MIFRIEVCPTPCNVRVPTGISSPLSVERRGCRRGRLPDRDDETSPQTGVVATIVFLIHVCGQIGLQDDWTKALTDQSTDGDLALLQVTSNRPNSQSPNFLLAVRSTFKKSGLQPFNAKGVGQGDSCGLPVT